MTRVFALFDGADKLQDAQDALERAGMTADIERVFDGTAENTTVPRPLVAGSVAPISTDGRPDGAAAVGLGRNWLAEFQVDDDEARFLSDSVSNGASLLIVRTERPDEVADIMNSAGGTRVFTKD